MFERSVLDHPDFRIYEAPRAILIAEDDPQVLHLYHHYFEEETIEVVYADHWSEDNRLPDGKTFDLICSDVRMGKTDMRYKRVDLTDHLSKNGHLIWITGQKRDLSDHWPRESHLVKPITKTEIIGAWNYHWQIYWSADPSMERLYADYDQHSTKIGKAQALLLREWTAMLSELGEAFEKSEVKAAHQVYHKLTTTLKRLNFHLQDGHIGAWVEDFDDEVMNKERARIIREFGQRVQQYLENLIANG